MNESGEPHKPAMGSFKMDLVSVLRIAGAPSRGERKGLSDMTPGAFSRSLSIEKLGPIKLPASEGMNRRWWGLGK